MTSPRRAVATALERLEQAAEDLGGCYPGGAKELAAYRAGLAAIVDALREHLDTLPTEEPDADDPR